MGCGKKELIFIIILSVFISEAHALKDNIIINSKDWKDVYAGQIYGNLVGKTPQFLASERHSTLILNGISKDDTILILSSKKKLWVSGYESTVKANGYDKVEERKFDTLTLELARELENISNFVIIDDSYGYNAIAVAPYAIISKSYVLFADKTNLVEIEDFLNERQPKNVLIYGHVDREVVTALKKFNPEIINKDGDRFTNNVEIVKKYMEISPTPQVLLSNGEFIEASLISGQYPTLFIGRNNVPDAVRQYVKNSDINTGVLIGNDLVGTATLIRRELGISVFVKFARSARSPSGPISQVEDLDLFFVPKVELSLNVSSVRYNKLTHQIEITYRNNADVATYFKGSYTLIEGDNEQSFGDIESVFIDANSFKTLVYDVDPLLTDQAILNVYTIFGESKNSLEFILEGKFDVSTVEVKDDTKIELKNAYYDKTKKKFAVLIENVGEKEVFADTEIIDVVILGEKVILGSEKIVNIKPGKTKKAYIPADISEGDINNNPSIRVRAYYGERENALIKIVEGTFELVVREATLLTYAPTIILVVLIILILLSLTKKKCASCGYKNYKFKKKCKKCGTELK